MATAVQVESLWNGLTDNNGQPLAAGKVFTYAAGTTTPVSLFTASDKSTSATNPLILDANGKAQVWADGRYKFVVKTAADVTLYTLDNLLYGFDDTTVLYGGTSTGSANAQVVSVPATVTSYANGQTVSFVAGFTNTGATTLKFNSLAAITLVKGPTPSSLEAGDLIAGQLYTATYHGGTFRLQDYPSVADVQRSRFAFATGVSGTNTITATLTPAPSSYETGMIVNFIAAATNTGAVTLNLNGLGARTVQERGVALTGSELIANRPVQMVYDGTNFQVISNNLGLGTAASPSVFLADDSNTGMYSPGADQIAFATNGIHVMTLNASQRVGIGATSPDARLTIGASTNGSGYAFKIDTNSRTTGEGYVWLGDAATPDFFINTTGNVGVGTSTPAYPLDVNGVIASNSTAGLNASMEQYSANTSGTQIQFIKSRGATIGTAGAVLSGDSVAILNFYGSDGTSNRRNAYIQSSIDTGTISATSMPGRIDFGTTPDGSVTSAIRMRITAAGEVLTGGTTDNGAYNLQCNGTGVWGAGAYVNGSDARIKENVTPIGSTLGIINQLNPVTYRYKEEWSKDQSVQPGFIAQEVASVLANCNYADGVVQQGGQYLGLAYQNLVPLLVKAVQELSAKVKELEAVVEV